MLPNATHFLKTQGLLWLADFYSALRVLIITVVLTLLGMAGWASAQEGELISPIEVLVNPAVVVNTVFETVVTASFPDVTICDPEGKCFTLTTEEPTK